MNRQAPPHETTHACSRASRLLRASHNNNHVRIRGVVLDECAVWTIRAMVSVVAFI